jgi:hypothetical protein
MLLRFGGGHGSLLVPLDETTIGLRDDGLTLAVLRIFFYSSHQRSRFLNSRPALAKPVLCHRVSTREGASFWVSIGKGNGGSYGRRPKYFDPVKYTLG